MPELPKLPLFKVGEMVDIFPAWKLAKIVSWNWDKKNKTFVYLLEGEDIHPEVFYPEDILITCPQQRPIAWGEENECVKWRVYIDRINDGYLRHKVFVDGAIYLSRDAYEGKDEQTCLTHGINKAVRLCREILQQQEAQT